MSAQPLFSGIYPMMYAFFGPDDKLDEQAMRRQVRAALHAGAHGIAVLGLATEVNKLSTAERHQIVEWLVEEIAGRVPLAVTVSEATVQAQAGFANWAKRQGADWVILQPPPERGEPEEYYARFFAQVMQRVNLPVAIQNAPEYLGVGLGPEAVLALRRSQPNFLVLKGEGPVLTVRRVIQTVQKELAVFNGRGGLELPDNLRAGCAGMIPSTDTFDYQVRVFDLMRTGLPGDEATAEAIYREVLPAIVFAMQSLDTLICYGKRMAAHRLGLGEVHDRAPALAPDSFGLTCAARYAQALGSFD